MSQPLSFSITSYFPPDPAADVYDAEASGISRRPLLSPADARVLVADPDASLRMVLCDVLRNEGYEVVEAATPREVWERQCEGVDLVVASFAVTLSNIAVIALKQPTLEQLTGAVRAALVERVRGDAARLAPRAG